jgi:transposase
MRYELADYEWIAIKPLLPNKPRGVPRVNDRRVLNGIFWVLRSGAPWRDLPEMFGPYIVTTGAIVITAAIGTNTSQRDEPIQTLHWPESRKAEATKQSRSSFWSKSRNASESLRARRGVSRGAACAVVPGLGGGRAVRSTS